MFYYLNFCTNPLTDQCGPDLACESKHTAALTLQLSSSSVHVIATGGETSKLAKFQTLDTRVPISAITSHCKISDCGADFQSTLTCQISSLSICPVALERRKVSGFYGMFNSGTLWWRYLAA